MGNPGQATPRRVGTILLVEDEEDVRSVVARLLERVGHRVTATVDAESALAAMSSSFFDAIVSDIRLPGLSGVELLCAVRERDLDVPVILMTGWPDIDTAAAAVEFGALQYLRKPVEPEQLRNAVDRAVRLHALARAQREALGLRGADAGSAGDRAGLMAVFERTMRGMTMALQPIVSAAKPWEIVAFEALLRGGHDGLRTPESVVAAAAELGRLPDLGRRTRELSAAALARLPASAMLFINIDAGELMHHGLAKADAPLASHAHRVVLEVTERQTLAETTELRSRVERLRSLGYRLALDDLGAGYASLNSFALLAPDFVKFDRLLIENCHRSDIQQRLIGSMVKVCNELGIQVVAEGIEREEERDAAVALGCHFLQGYLFGRPGPV